MIKANELRIGNLVSEIEWFNKDNELTNENKIITVSQIFNDAQSTAFLYPILLTEEWLLKFGFEKIDEIEFRIPFERDWYYRFLLRKDEAVPNYGIMAICDDDEVRNFAFDIIYVHQLQNLYFALMGKELKVNNEVHTSSSSNTPQS